MSFCELMLTVGLSFGGICAEEPVEPRGLPDSDPGIFDYQRPPPPPEPVKREIVMMPPVITKETVEVEKPVEVEKVVYVEKPVYVKPAKKREPDPLELAMQAELRARTGGQAPLGSRGLLGAAQVSQDAPARGFQPPAATGAAIAAFQPPQGIDPDNDRYQAPPRISTSAVDNTRIVAADRYITGVLESGINSQLSGEGTVVVQVSRPVFGYHGRHILIPKGSRMICRYDSVEKVGQSRIGFTCERILLGESRAEIFQLKAKVGDAQGYAGVSGEVDNRWWEKYGSAVLTVGIGAAVEAAVSMSSELGSDNSDTVREAMSGISENVGQLSAHFLEETVDLKPIVRISQGTRVQIRPEYDWYLARP